MCFVCADYKGKVSLLAFCIKSRLYIFQTAKYYIKIFWKLLSKIVLNNTSTYQSYYKSEIRDVKKQQLMTSISVDISIHLPSKVIIVEAAK